MLSPIFIIFSWQHVHGDGASKVQMFPPKTVAASLVPSLEEVMPIHSFVFPTEVSSVQVAFTGVMTLSESRATSRTLNTLRRDIVCVVGGMRVRCAGGLCGSSEIFVIFLILGRVGVSYIFLGHKDTNTLLS